jgi:hypothetical protein
MSAIAGRGRPGFLILSIFIGEFVREYSCVPQRDGEHTEALRFRSQDFEQNYARNPRSQSVRLADQPPPCVRPRIRSVWVPFRLLQLVAGAFELRLQRLNLRFMVSILWSKRAGAN